MDAYMASFLYILNDSNQVVKSGNPIDLKNEWIKEYKRYRKSNGNEVSDFEAERQFQVRLSELIKYNKLKQSFWWQKNFLKRTGL